MNRKPSNPNFEQTLESLRQEGFEIQAGSDSASTALVIKNGAAAVLAAVKKSAPAISAGPAAWIGGQMARLTDHGFQKYLQTEDLKLPATAERLQAIHRFDQELRLCLGLPELFNESLGSTSQVHHYDRLSSR